MTPAYALILSLCLQGDECITRKTGEYSTLSACLKQAVKVAALFPEADVIECDNQRYSSGDAE